LTATQKIIDRPLLVVVAGPTAVGKTTFAITLAGHFHTEIISADSRQFYREMSIGTAVPSEQERAAIKHHFIQHGSIHEPYNASRFETEALSLLNRLFQTHPMVVLTGGSGLYIEAVCHGVDQLPDPDPMLRSTLKNKMSVSGISALQEELIRLDPVYSMQVDMMNPARIIRALEVCITSGIPYSSFRTNTPKPRDFRIMKIGLELPRTILYERINARVDAMMQGGLFEEALSLYPDRHLAAMNTVGYRELFDHFSGLTTLEHAVEKIKTNSRRYAKRQLTWFKRDPGYRWIQPSEIQNLIREIRLNYDILTGPVAL
jgi:tRNA dimethylallyltransferase